MHSSAFWTALLGPVTVEAGRRPGWGLVWVALGCCYNAYKLGGLEQNDSLTLRQPEVSDPVSAELCSLRWPPGRTFLCSASFWWPHVWTIPSASGSLFTCLPSLRPVLLS